MQLNQFLQGLETRKNEAGQSTAALQAPGSKITANRAKITGSGADARTRPQAPEERTAVSHTTRQALEPLRQRLHTLLVDKLDLQELNAIPEERRRGELKQLIEVAIDADKTPLSQPQKAALVDQLLDDMLGLGPLEPLLHDPAITDILINGANSVYVERGGVLEQEPNVSFRDNDHLLQIIHRIVSLVGRRVNESSPMVDARLADGSRFNAIIPPLALDGPLVSIRRFGARPLRIADLLGFKTLTPEMCRYLEAAVLARLNILVSGGTGSGKTTLLNTLSSFIPATERLITIEDSAELILQQRHVGRLEARPPNLEGEGEVTIRDLVRNALRMRPNRIIVGECRGPEALDMLQAMNTGHEGSLTTLHANNPRDALSRLETMILSSKLELPLRAIRQQIASAINVIVQVDHLLGGPRRITHITEIVGSEQDVISLQDLFLFQQHGVDVTGKAYGEFACTGLRSRYDERFRTRGFSLPPDLFSKRILLKA